MEGFGLSAQGDAVWSLTAMFLAMWEYLRGEPDTLEDFMPPRLEHLPPNGGFIQPFADNPWTMKR